MNASRDDFFINENEKRDSREEHVSPSGKYVLTTSRYATKPGCWNYSRGVVRSAATGQIVGDIKRNYSAFPFLWVEGHPNGHDYLVGGESYQGQTVIELDTGRRRDFLPEDAKKGFGFCWAEYQFETSTRTLVVEGCIWACPYEFRLYDFSDPMEGWPELETSAPIWNDPRWPTFESGGTIKTYETAPEPDDVEYEDDEEEPNPLTRPVVATTSFRREGQKLVIAERWMTDEERARRKARAEAHKRYDDELASFKANDPLYLTYQKLLRDPVFKPETYESTGVTFDGWCPDFKEKERRHCRRIHQVRDEKGHYDKNPGWVSIDLEWAATTGPVKLQIYRDGAETETTFYPHSVEGMEQAFAQAKGAVTA